MLKNNKFSGHVRRRRCKCTENDNKNVNNLRIGTPKKNIEHIWTPKKIYLKCQTCFLSYILWILNKFLKNVICAIFSKALFYLGFKKALNSKFKHNTH